MSVTVKAVHIAAQEMLWNVWIRYLLGHIDRGRMEKYEQEVKQWRDELIEAIS